MRYLILLMITFLLMQPVFMQVPSKVQMMAEMDKAVKEIKDQIAGLNRELAVADGEETKKNLRDRIVILKKQLQTMEGVNKSVSGMSAKVFKEAAAEEEASGIPGRDAARINIIPKRTLTETELVVFVKKVHGEVEKLIPAGEKREALTIYEETKAKYHSSDVTGNAASGCWMLGHWEKALFILGKSCIDDVANTDNLNNYAAFLIMTGGEQAAVPILDYLNREYRNNSTILNNLGQAWFGLGEMDKAKKYLDNATALYPNHSTANAALSEVALVNSETEKAISFLKASLKESYDPEKEAALRKLGYEIKFADLPPLNYPMKEDPLGLIPLITSWNPNKIQASIADGETAIALQGFVKGVKNLSKELDDESMTLDQKLVQRGKKLSVDSPYRRQFLDPYTCPAYFLAARSLQLYCLEKSGVCLKRPQTSSPLIAGLWLPLPEPFPGLDQLVSVGELMQDCEQVWFKNVMEPMGLLGKSLTSTESKTCTEEDAKMDAYLSKRKEIYSKGIKSIQNEFIRKSKALTNYIKYTLYAALDDPPKDINDLSMGLVAATEERILRRRIRNKYCRVILSLMVKAENFETRYKSSCGRSSLNEPDQAGDILAPLKVETVKCEYIKHVITPVRYEFILQCNTMTEKINSKLEKRKPHVRKGSANNASRRNSTRGPIQSPRGPSNRFYDATEVQASAQKGPLTPENKDISQFSLEYDKWGNLVGFNFQLSEDGATLKDPDSVESGIDSRWSWNATASPKKGFLNKLLMK